MKKILLGAVALAALAGQANAASLVSAAVTGPTGTVWDTTQNSFYTLFLQSPGLGDFVNGTNPAINQTVTTGTNRYLLAGEGFRPGETADSDPLFTLTLNFDDGATLTGQYNPLSNTFLGSTSTTVGRNTYTLNEFSYRRYLGDAVSAYEPTPGGDGNDYAGNFRFTASTAAVPEPATWAMMIGGIGFAGTALRRRRNVRTAVSFG